LLLQLLLLPPPPLLHCPLAKAGGVEGGIQCLNRVWPRKPCPGVRRTCHAGDDSTRAVSFHEERTTQIAMFKKAVSWTHLNLGWQIVAVVASPHR